MGILYDKTGREIVPGDVLKVFHFIGSRHKRHYMYKQALRYDESGYLRISHLNRINDSDPWVIGSNYYIERANDRILPDFEIVDSIDAKFEDRPRPALSKAGGT